MSDKSSSRKYMTVYEQRTGMPFKVRRYRWDTLMAMYGGRNPFSPSLGDKRPQVEMPAEADFEVLETGEVVFKEADLIRLFQKRYPHASYHTARGKIRQAVNDEDLITNGKRGQQRRFYQRKALEWLSDQEFPK